MLMERVTNTLTFHNDERSFSQSRRRRNAALLCVDSHYVCTVLLIHKTVNRGNYQKFFKSNQ